jgi:hypothetical protein
MVAAMTEVVVETFGFSVLVPEDLFHIEALYPTEKHDGDPSLDFAIAMELGTPPDFDRMTGVGLTERKSRDLWAFDASVSAVECPPLDAAVFATRFQDKVERTGHEFMGVTTDVRLGGRPAFEVAWRVKERVSTLRLTWWLGVRYSAQLGALVAKREQYDAAWRAIVDSFELG